MKWLSIFLCCLFTLQGIAQTELKGKYCFTWGGSVCMEFNRKNNFTWETSGDLGVISVGKGSYEIKQGKLYLKFKQDSLTYDSTTRIEKIEETDKENVTLTLKVVDHYGQPLAAVDIVSDNDTIPEYRTDLEGFLKIQNIPKSEETIIFNTPNLLGFENYEFEFIPKVDATMLGTLYPQKPRIISGKTFVFEIIKSSREKLVLKNTSGQVQEFVRSD